MKFPDKRDGHYYLPGADGKMVKLPSVTSILSVLAKPQLIRWAAREAAKAVLEDPHTYNTVEKAAAVPFTRKDEAADTGRSVHEAIEAWFTGKGLDDRSGGYWEAFRRFVRVNDPKPLYVECTVYSLTHGYAGTTDLIAEMGGETWLADFKTSKSVYYEYHLQTAAYRNCEWLKTHDGRLLEMPRVDRTAVVLLRPDGTYSFEETRGDFELFLHLKEVYVRLREAGQI